MHRNLTGPLAALCLLIMSIPSVGAAAGWVRFAPVDGGFSVWMPAPPHEHIQASHTALGLVRARVAVATLGAGLDAVHFVVAFNDFPVESSPGDAERVLDADCDKALGPAVLESRRHVAQNGQVGRDLSFHDVTHRYRMRLFLIGRRLYQITVIAPVVKPYPAETERFVESFALH